MRASYDEIPKSVQDEVYTGAEAFVKANKGRYECGGYLRRVSDKACKNQLATLTTDNSGNGLHQGIIRTDGLSGR